MSEERRTHVPPAQVAGRIPLRPGMHHVLTLGIEVRMLLHVLDDDVTRRDTLVLRRSDGEGEEQRIEMGGLEEVEPGFVEAIFHGVLPGLPYDGFVEPGGDGEKVYPIFLKTVIANEEGVFEIQLPEEEEEEEEEPSPSTAGGVESTGEGSSGEDADAEAEAETDPEDADQPADLPAEEGTETWTEEERDFYTRGVIADDFYEDAPQDEEEETGTAGGLSTGGLPA